MICRFLTPLSQLKRSVRDALAYLKTQPDITEGEVFASANGNLTVRLNYTSRIPSNWAAAPGRWPHLPLTGTTS